MNDQQKVIADKLSDCRRTGFLCLYLGAFLQVGTLLPKFSDLPEKQMMLSLSSLLFLLMSLFFYWRTAKLREKMED
ncbi:MAG: YrhC family protein [Sporolactobacillus sp.]